LKLVSRLEFGSGATWTPTPSGCRPWIRRCSARSIAWPTELVTNHNAFGYYIDHYSPQFVGSVIPSFDSSAELSGRDIRDLVAKIKATGVKAVFSETSLPPRTAETIARLAPAGSGRADPEYGTSGAVGG
jgi:hypothetical protein